MRNPESMHRRLAHRLLPMRKVPGEPRGAGVDRTAALLLVAILATGILPAPATADSSASVTEAARLQATIQAGSEQGHLTSTVRGIRETFVASD